VVDTVYEALFLGGLLLAAIGWAWLVAVAFRTSRKWGLLVALVPPSVVFFAARCWRQARAPLGVVVAGLVTAASPAIYTRVAPVDLGPRATLVDGERHLTLTGWDRTDYSVLRQYPEAVVLQMANADVTDDTLRLLEDLPELRELDISGSQATDAGLAVLAKLPQLETLRLKGCRITDAGFRVHLLPHPGLLRLDLVGTSVSPETVRAWRKANPQRRAMQ